MNKLRQSRAWLFAVFFPSALMLTLLCHPAYCADAGSAAQALLDLHGNEGGFAVYVGEGQDDMVLQLGKHSSYCVHGLLRSDERVARTRQRLSDAGLYGRNRVQKWDGGDLPYIANLVSLLICESTELVSVDEALRVLSPGGLALFRDGAGWKQLQKPLNPDTDDWPQHFYDAQNNPVCKDKLVAPPRHLQWRGSPRWGRFHEKMSSFAAMVSTGGRVFYIMDHGSPSSVFFPSRWKLVARDAYNGVVLWSQPIDEWVTRFYPYKAGPATVPRRLVATDDVVYATLGIKSPISAICARTGRTLHTYEDTAYADEMILAGNLLLAVIRPSLQIPSSMDDNVVGRSGRFGWQNESAKLAVFDTETGKRIWELDTPITPLGVAADASCVYVCDWEKILCVDRLTGSSKWASKKLGIPSRYQGGLGPRLVVKDGVVLFANSENVFNRKGWAGPPDPLVALSAENGQQLWAAEHSASGFHSPEDLFVIDGTVWFGATMDGNGRGTFTGLDLKTGVLKSSFDPDRTSYWFHQRCYPQKATEKYILTSRTGIEYVDPVAKHWELNHWVRGACTFGVIPANGLTYAPQHPCACYPESKLSGMNALAASQRYSLNPKPETPRLEKGPAYGDPLSPEAKVGPQDWPLLRGDISRSSYAPVTLSGTPKQRWAVNLGGDLTSPIVAGGTIYLAEKTTDTVLALDAESGKTRWSFTANGKVDSPPAYAHGHVVFGSRDGYVYCLNAKSGALRWRFLAAEQDKRLFNFEQLESVWPVFGSVLILDQQVCFTAGRSLFLDGGITFYKLDLVTGEVVSQQRWDERGPSGENYHAKVDRLSMPAANNDVLSSNGKHIFMSSQVVTMDGERIMTEVGARHNVDEHSHIFSPSGLLDDSWWHRSYVAYGNGVSGGAGWGSTLKAVIGGKIMCADEENIYSFGRKAKYNRWTLPLEFQLASTSKTQGKPNVKAVPKKADENEDSKKGKKSRKARNSTPDLSNPFRVNWSTTIPIWVKAMFVTQDKVVIAGPRDLYDEETAVARFTQNDKRFSLQQEHMEGKHGSLLKIIDKASGNETGSVELACMPTFDGMVTAEGKIFMTTSGGQVVCFDCQTRQ